MTVEPIQGTTTLLLSGSAEDSVIGLRFGPELVDELTGLAAAKQIYDVIVIKSEGTDLTFGVDLLMEVAQIACKLLSLQGGIVFATSEKALAVVRETLMGMLSFHAFDNLAELYD